MSTSGAMKRVLLSGTKYQRSLSTTAVRLNVKDNILYHPRNVEIPKISLPEYVFGRCEIYKDLTAFECPTTKRKLTYADVRNNSRNLSKSLRKKLGLNSGDVALVYLPNCPDFPVTILGCLEAGVVASTVNSMYTADEIGRQIKDSNAKIIITCYELYDNAVKAAAKVPERKIPIICIKTKQEQCLPQGAVDFFELISTNIDIPDLEPAKPDDIAILPYSSGTTGLPKGVMLTHSNIVANLCQLSDKEVDLIHKADDSFQETTPGVLPMFHIYGFTITTMNVMVSGARVLTMPRFTPESFVQVLRDYPVSLLFGAPPLILFLTLYPDVKAEYFKTLRHVMSGAAPLGATDENRFLEKVGKDVFISQGYGLTETSPVVSTTTKATQDKYPTESKGSIGKVVANTEVKIIKVGQDSGEPLGPNEQGELLVKGPQVMKGYHNNQQATAGAFLDGWFRTGDLAYYDKNGLLFITDRVKELIKVKGFQVAPAELEELLRDHPKIADAAVVGIPHMINGEVPRAYIQVKDEVDLEEVQQFVADKVAKYKRLEGGVEVVKEIPKNSAETSTMQEDTDESTLLPPIVNSMTFLKNLEPEIKYKI